MRRAALALAVLAAAAGCGGGRPDPGDGAAFVPAGAQAFVAVRTANPGWRAFVRTVLGRAAPRAPRGTDELDVALVGGRLRVLAHVDGHWRGVRPARALANDPRYREAAAAAPQGADGVAYLRGDVTARRLLAIPGQVQILVANYASHYRTVPPPGPPLGTAVLRYRWGAAWLTRDGYGGRARSAGLPVAVSSHVRTVEQLVPAYTPTLFDEIPADATSVLDVPLGPASFSLVPLLPPPLARLFPRDRLDVVAELDRVFQGETALYRRRGGELTIVTSPPDTKAAFGALDDLGIHLHRATIGGQLVLSTTRAGIAAFRGGGAKLSADAAFRKAGMPAEVAGAVYRTRARPLVGWVGREGRDATFAVRFIDGSR